MKHKPGKPHAKNLHQPIPELIAAAAMPENKRRKGRNVISPHWNGRCQGGYLIAKVRQRAAALKLKDDP